jgi:hypothetical protein
MKCLSVSHGKPETVDLVLLHGSTPKYEVKLWVNGKDGVALKFNMIIYNEEGTNGRKCPAVEWFRRIEDAPG